MGVSGRTSKISSVIAALCIVIYIVAIAFAVVQIIVNIGDRRNLAEKEFYDLADRASSSAVFLGYMSEAYRETVKDFLGTSETLLGVIISDSGGAHPFERYPGSGIVWTGASPQFKTRPIFPVEPFYLPLRIEGQRNVNIQAVYSYIDHALLLEVLRNTLLAVLAALAIALITLILEFIQKGKQQQTTYTEGHRADSSVPKPSKRPNVEIIRRPDFGAITTKSIEPAPSLPDIPEPEESLQFPDFTEQDEPLDEPSSVYEEEEEEEEESDSPDIPEPEESLFDAAIIDDEIPQEQALGEDTPEEQAPEKDAFEEEAPQEEVALEETEPEEFVLDEPELDEAVLDEAEPEEIEPQKAGNNPQGLFTARGNIGWESYTHDRLASELHRCASFEQDLAFLVMEFKGPEKLSDTLYRQFADEAVAFFTMRDLIFERGEKGISIIIPSANLEQGMLKSEEFLSRINAKLPASFEDRSKLYIGLSSRCGRLIDANRIMMEATTALDKTREDPTSPIVAFKSDPEKYREYIKSRS